ncbi:PEPxxWA-CTERM sorting domain-containing protein [Sphingomonas sp. ID1715]|uniref:PEPxxWA-CTERM sorting domain-containing protein n=1 Tax=Sphingomonas sp. ID1715 TaxID=1656898 RepID=UPI0014896397|nr:PEPxxWA-CTERM sorting domain-containing protein [Sphingomonas sp. ID1715]NNM76800.1 PEPxxWA-CTERM sorting domain-containing protein [Sphingomonas sp. ID1715]
MQRLVFGALVAFSANGMAVAAPTNLSTWTAEGPGNWVRAADNNSVTQTLNGNPTVFYSDFAAQGTRLSGTVKVNSSSDDDFFGFVLGFKPGELSAATSDFLLVDWKQIDQGSFGGTAKKGLALSRVTSGLANSSGAWWHNPADGVTELARGATLGSTAWVDFQTYTFDIQFTASNVKVFVDNVLQFDVNGTFSDGRFGFYNYSQAQVIYAGISDEPLPPPPPPPPAVPEPASWTLMIAGFALAGATARRRSRRIVLA